jgi:hypothetical protein
MGYLRGLKLVDHVPSYGFVTEMAAIGMRFNHRIAFGVK